MDGSVSRWQMDGWVCFQVTDGWMVGLGRCNNELDKLVI